MKWNDEELYNNWKANPNDYNLDKLVKNFDGILHTALAKYSGGTVSESNLASKGTLLIIEAIKSYNTNIGASLSSWVSTYLKKLSRYYSKSILNPVSEATLYNSAKLLKEDSDLLENIGKNALNKARLYTTIDLTESGQGTNTLGLSDQLTYDDIEYAISQLDEKDKALFKLKTGYKNKKPLPLKDISAKTGLSVATLSRRLETIAEKIKNILNI